LALAIEKQPRQAWPERTAQEHPQAYNFERERHRRADPDAHSMATSGKDTGIVGYNVQIAVDTRHHLIVAHDVTTWEVIATNSSKWPNRLAPRWLSRRSMSLLIAATTRAKSFVPVSASQPQREEHPHCTSARLGDYPSA
jgi:hypothetical protein